LALAFSVSSHAASVTYNLAYSNNAAGHISGDPLLVTDDIPNDGTTYATVTIDDMGATGLINFTVATSSYWDGKEDSGFGIQSFGFNLSGAATGLVVADVGTSTIPSNWGVTLDDNQDGLGNFGVSISKTGTGQPNRQDPLKFSIDLGLDQSTTDDIFDYVADSIAGDNGSFLFAVHIAGFLDQNPDDPLGSCTVLDANDPACNLLTSVWVGAPVPVPAAVWLFGSGLIGLVGLARRKKA
jgi:hypothetical protein